MIHAQRTMEAILEEHRALLNVVYELSGNYRSVNDHYLRMADAQRIYEVCSRVDRMTD